MIKALWVRRQRTDFYSRLGTDKAYGRVSRNLKSVRTFAPPYLGQNLCEASRVRSPLRPSGKYKICHEYNARRRAIYLRRDISYSIAYCVLRIAYCVLRIAYCVLPVTSGVFLLAYGVWSFPTSNTKIQFTRLTCEFLFGAKHRFLVPGCCLLFTASWFLVAECLSMAKCPALRGCPANHLTIS